MIKRLSESTLSLQVRVKCVPALKGHNIVAQGTVKRRQPQATPWVSSHTSVSAEKTGVCQCGRRPRPKQAGLVSASVDGRTLAHLTPRPSYGSHRTQGDGDARKGSLRVALGYDV